MKAGKPLVRFGMPATRPAQPKNPTSFGEKRAQQMNNSLQKAMDERKVLVKKELASPDPLNKLYQQKGYQLDAQIKKLKDSK